ncbi:MAG: SCP2 sterol-binding domain-containing protein [Myxococcota bacterium]
MVSDEEPATPALDPSIKRSPGTDPAEFFASVPRDGVLHALPDGVSVTFDLRGPGGGVWTVERDGDETRIRRQDGSSPDCRLSCSVRDFQALLGGSLEPMKGFVERRLVVEGDVGLVLRLHRSVL